MFCDSSCTQTHSSRLAIAAQHLLQQLLRERIELLDADDGHVVRLRLACAARAGRNRPCRCTAARGARGSASAAASSSTSWNRPVISSSTGETAALCRSRLLGVISDQRLAEVALHLPPQHVEVLRRRRRIAHLDVVLGAQLQEALQPGAGVLRPLALRSRAAAASPGRCRAATSTRCDAMNWSMITWAPLAKSPNCASHSTSVSGASSE